MLCNWLQFVFSHESAKLRTLQIKLQNALRDYLNKITLPTNISVYIVV